MEYLGFFFGLTWLFVVFYQVMSFSRTRSPTRKLRMGYCGKLKERLVLLNFLLLQLDCESQVVDVELICVQWVVQGAVDVDIGANPSAEGGDEDEGVDDQTVKVVDIVDTFRLQVSFLCYLLNVSSCFLSVE